MAELSAIDALLNSDVNVEEKYFVKRLDTYFTIKAIDGDTLNKIREEASDFEGRGKKKQKVVDGDKLGYLTIAAGCADPDFADPRVLEKFGAPTAGECVKKALLAGEIFELHQAILELSGFTADEDEDEIEDVKNS
ncbi:phage tail assembly chaperone [Bacillus chungangensis]|uniref:Phage portal protein n=1 Tax=Bacillus chungangensis TaxID=587633 RepID=A0ABT9WMD7_9BACI|nr:hypothetical protein [Bacillus chungangensis]MDQ0174376.1 hypothetical protein [Bacillus chungangensis]